MTKKRAKTTMPDVAESVAGGKSAAATVLEFRATQRRRRARAVRVATAAPLRRRARASQVVPTHTATALGPPAAAGLLIAEGDSWFDYPLNDVLRILEDEYGFDVESVAHKGDRVEDMAYSGGQFEEFARRLEKLLRQQRVPNAILLSGGGNDIAGDELAVLLNHARSGLPTINDDVVRGVVDVRLRNAYAFLISGLTEITRHYLERPVPILLHGYDYPVPDGRGFLGGWGPLPGPWLQPSFNRKALGNVETNKDTMRLLLDVFNTMLRDVSGTPGFEHVHYVNLRGTLGNGAAYRTDWANELHPTPRGFAAVTARFAAALHAV